MRGLRPVSCSRVAAVAVGLLQGPLHHLQPRASGAVSRQTLLEALRRERQTEAGAHARQEEQRRWVGRHFDGAERHVVAIMSAFSVIFFVLSALLCVLWAILYTLNIRVCF